MNNGEVDWEVRPGGMLVGAADGGPMVSVNVSYGPSQYEVFVPVQSTFGDIKNVLFHKIGLKPEEQRLLFRGKEKDDEEWLVVAGVKNNSKVVLLLDESASKERSLESGEVAEAPEVSTEEVNVAEVSIEMVKAFEAVARVRDEVDKLAERVSALEVVVSSGIKVDEKEFVVTTELLMRQLLNLDGIEAEGEAKMQRRAEVRRVQKLVDSLDSLKARNSNPVNTNNAVSVTTQWETFDSGMGSLNPPPPTQSSAQVSQDWERFE